jgi:hypothetical protein
LDNNIVALMPVMNNRESMIEPCPVPDFVVSNVTLKPMEKPKPYVHKKQVIVAATDEDEVWSASRSRVL